MKIKKDSNKTKRVIIITLAALVVLSISLVAVAYQKKLWPFQVTPVDTDSRQDTVNESPKNNNPIKKEDSKSSINEGMNSDQIPVAEDFSATITQLDQTGDTVNFAAKINNSPSPGTCVVTFSNPNDRPVTRQFDSTVKDSVSVCGPLAIPSLEFSYLGEWNVSLRYYVGTKQAIVDGKVVIK